MKAKMTTWWLSISARERVLVKVLFLMVVVACTVLFYVRPFVLGTYKKQVEIKKLINQIGVDSQRLAAVKLEVEMLSHTKKDKLLEKGKRIDSVPLLLKHLGKEQSKLGYKVMLVSMPNPPKSAYQSTLTSKDQNLQNAAKDMNLSNNQQSLSQDPNQSEINMMSLFSKTHLDIKLKASYEQLGKFIESVDSLPIILTVKQMRIAKEDEGMPNRVDLTFNIVSRDK